MGPCPPGAQTRAEAVNNGRTATSHNGSNTTATSNQTSNGTQPTDNDGGWRKMDQQREHGEAEADAGVAWARAAKARPAALKLGSRERPSFALQPISSLLDERR